MKKKNIILIIISFIGVMSVFGQQPAQTKQEAKAKELIRQHLFENLNDYKSYEPVLYSAIDTLYRPIEEDSTYQANLLEDVRLKKEFEELRDMMLAVGDYYNGGMEGAKQSVMKMWEESYKPKLLAHTLYIAAYKAEPIGLKITHRYRAKNALGATVINEYIYGFDFSMTEIISVSPKE